MPISVGGSVTPSFFSPPPSASLKAPPAESTTAPDRIDPQSTSETQHQRSSSMETAPKRLSADTGRGTVIDIMG